MHSGGQGCDRDFVIKRIITPERVCQSDGFLCIALVRHSWRIQIRIRKTTIHRRPSGLTGISQPANLHGSGFTGKDQQSVSGHRHGQIHKNVNLVIANQSRHLFVVDTNDSALDVDHRSQSLSNVIRSSHVSIANDLKVLMIVRWE